MKAETAVEMRVRSAYFANCAKSYPDEVVGRSAACVAEHSTNQTCHKSSCLFRTHHMLKVVVTQLLVWQLATNLVIDLLLCKCYMLYLQLQNIDY